MGSVYSVSQINSYIKNMFLQDFMLNNISIKGEISNCKYHSSGHIYFSLKDEKGVISAVMFAGNRKGLAFKMEEGQNVIVTGSISIYELSGKYQIYAKEIIKDGNGLLFQKYEELKKQLEEMGMFDALYKKQIPKYATKVGIVTASTGAAIHDIINISKRRNPYVKLILCPAFVQGEFAVASITEGIKRLDALDLDVIIVGRGGGSIEDLWAFNEEEVAKAIFNCRTPVISAVGHETDVTIADFVADLRAPTPSAAAELAIFDYKAFINTLENTKYSLSRIMQNKLQNQKMILENHRMHLKYLSPESVLATKKQYLDDAYENLCMLMKKNVDLNKYRLSLCAERLNGLSPLKKLDKGFAFIQSDGKPLKTIEKVSVGSSMSIFLKDGSVEACVTKIENGGILDVRK